MYGNTQFGLLLFHASRGVRVKGDSLKQDKDEMNILLSDKGGLVTGDLGELNP